MSARIEWDRSRVVITGAAGGIGSALALELARNGSEIVGLDFNADGLSALSLQMKKQGYLFQSFKVDLSDRDASKNIVDKAFEGGRVKVWFHCAGSSSTQDFATQRTQSWERVLEMNLTSVMRITQHVLERFDSQGVGTMVFVGSVAGTVPAPFLAAYCASKAGLAQFTRSLREELRLQDSNTQVALVMPGFVDTPMIQGKSGAVFPSWIRPILSTPTSIARDIRLGVEKGRAEFVAGLSGHAMRLAYSLLPSMTVKSSTVLLAPSFSDWVMGRWVMPKVGD